MDINSGIQAGLQNLANSRAALDARRGGGGVDPAALKLQMEYEERLADKQFQRAISEQRIQEQKAADMAEKERTFQMALMERQNEMARQQQKEQFEAQAAQILEQLEREKTSRLQEMEAMFRGEREAAVLSREEALRAEQARAVKQRELHEAQFRAISAQDRVAVLTDKTARAVGSALADRFGTAFGDQYQADVSSDALALMTATQADKTNNTMFGAMWQTMFSDGSNQRQAFEAKQSALNQLSQRMSQFSPKGIDDAEAIRRGLDSLFVAAARAGSSNATERKSWQRDYREARDRLAEIVGPVGMVYMGDVLDAVDSQIDTLYSGVTEAGQPVTDAEGKPTIQDAELNQRQSIDNMKAFIGVFRADVFKSNYEAAHPRMMFKAFDEQMGLIMTDTELNDSERFAAVERAATELAARIKDKVGLDDETFGEIQGLLRQVAVARAEAENRRYAAARLGVEMPHEQAITELESQEPAETYDRLWDVVSQAVKEQKGNEDVDTEASQPDAS
jgi:hypothetical protein